MKETLTTPRVLKKYLQAHWAFVKYINEFQVKFETILVYVSQGKNYYNHLLNTLYTYNKIMYIFKYIIKYTDDMLLFDWLILN